MNTNAAPVFDCIIFSGGGAKGAFGAGAAMALTRYRSLKAVNTTPCWIGASAGAINALVMAMHGPERLLSFWRNAKNRKVLGVRILNRRFQVFTRSLTRHLPFNRKPFSVYPNTGLRRMIEPAIDAAALNDKHVIIAATDYTEGRMKCFARSPLLGAYKALDDRAPADRRRLAHWDSLTDDIMIDTLLASCAIPLFFPPVMIRGSWYIDGGVGNNTPTREAAYFLRYLKETGSGTPGEVYCIKLNPPRQRHDGPLQEGLLDLASRTVDVYHHLHTQPIINAWYRISTEVKDRERISHDLQNWVAKQGLPETTARQVMEQIRARLVDKPGVTERLELPLHIVEPSQALGDTLDFEADVDNLITSGYTEMLKMLKTSGKLSPAEYETLLNQSLRE